MGGSMAVTQGLLDEFGPDRVRNTPISEMAIVGSGIGAAIQGMRPIVEIMYEDFLTISMEQIVNQAAKHRTMSGGQVKVPLTIRTQGGAGWSPGAQHAQQLEAWFVHVPGLKVVFASTPEDVRGLLWSAIYDDNPVIFFEHRTLYPIKGEVPDELEPIPLGKARIHREGTDVTVVATGRLVHESLQAAEEAEKDGISVEVVDPRTLSPLDEETIVGSVRKTTRCVTAHEAVTRGGFGAELAAVIQHGAFDWLDAPIERVGAKFAPLAFAPGDGAVGRPARRRRARRDPPDGRPGVGDGDRGQAPASGPGHGVRHDRPLAEDRGRAGHEGRAALRARHRQGDAGGRGRVRRRPAQDRRRRGRGRRRDHRRRHRRAGRGGRRAGRRARQRQRPTATAPPPSAEPATTAEPAPDERAERRRAGDEAPRDAAPRAVGGRCSRAPARGRRARQGEPARASDCARARRRPRAVTGTGPEGRIDRRGRREGGVARPAAAPAPAAPRPEVEVVAAHVDAQDDRAPPDRGVGRRRSSSSPSPRTRPSSSRRASASSSCSARARRSRPSTTCSPGSSRRRSMRHRAGQRELRRRRASSLRRRPTSASRSRRRAASSFPVIRDADRQSVQEIAADRADIVVSRARTGSSQLPGPRGRARSRSRTSGCSASSSSSPSSTRRRSRSSPSARSRIGRSASTASSTSRRS